MRRAIALRVPFPPIARQLFGGGGNYPRAILRDADRTFRQLEKFVDRVTDQLDIPESASAADRYLPGQNDIFSDFLTTTSPMSYVMQLRPSFEWKETEHGFLLTASTPGLRKEDLNVEIIDVPKGGGHFLVISGESKQAQDLDAEHEKKDKEHDKEKEKEKEKHKGKKGPVSFSAVYRKFEQRFRLPEGIDKNSLTAKYDNGILQVHINFPEHEKSERKTVEITS